MTARDFDITSPNNRWIKLARSLIRRRRRYQERAFLVEGVRPLRDAIRANARPITILVDGESQDDDVHALARAFDERGDRVLTAPADLVVLASDTDSPQGITGIFPMPDDEPFPSPSEPALFVIADRIRDPGNLGTLMRTALAAGANGMLIAPRSADPYGPKVVRAAAGAHFRLPFRTFQWESLSQWVGGCTIVAAEAQAATIYDEFDWTTSVCIVIGNETQGLSAEAITVANLSVGIPLANEVESLNAATAGAALLFEAARQRRRAVSQD
jgi:RNA methyltransferase, TrmH family